MAEIDKGLKRARDSRRCELYLPSFLLCLFIFFANLASAQMLQVQPQSADTDPQKTYTVTGTVINALTGEPITRALVQTSWRSVMTASDGTFEISGFPSGMYSLQARKPGFFSDEELHPGRPPAFVRVAEIKNPIVVKLTPQSVITGHITDSNGEPIENIPVAVYSTGIQDGRKRRTYGNQATTDEDGEFRLSGLRTGQYLLSAGPAFAGPSSRQFPPTKVDRKGFGKTYYAGVPDRAEATPISIAPGQHAAIDFSLEASPLYQVSIRITGAPPNGGPALQVFTRDGDDTSALSSFYDPAAGTYRLSLPGGIFTIKAFTQITVNQRMQMLKAQTQVNVNGDLDNIILALAPTVSIPIELRTESTKPDSSYSSPNFRPNANVHLVPDTPFGNDQFSQPDSAQNPSLVLKDVEPGRYWVQVENSFPGYVQSVRCGSQDLTREMLTIADGQRIPPIEIVLRDDSATLAAQIRSETPFRMATVLLVGPGNPEMAVKTTQIWNGASSALSGLAPGDYTVYAFDDVSALEYRNPDALSTYSSRAAHVTLAADGKTNVLLDLIHVEE
jgi:Carboxypeptidase regulatory-like domain